MAKAEFELDLNETFPHLGSAPVVEAVIHWRARAQKPLEEETLRSALTQIMLGYKSPQPVQRFSVAARLSEESSPVAQQQRGWLGYRMASDDDRHIVQFTLDGVSVSRLEPYENWQRFTATAIPVWRAFIELASPVEVQRLGVRFINHIRSATPETLREVLIDPPSRPSNLPLSDFVYQSAFAVPGHPYGIRVIKLMQPSAPDVPRSSGLFLDCDVFTTKPISCEERSIDNALEAMHWLKNKVFFSLLTDETIRSFT